MTMMIETILFWLAIVLLLHSYLFFPVLVNLMARKKEMNTQVYETHSVLLPFVSVIIAAYNEEKVIEQRIHDVMLSDYPHEKFEVIVGSDASTDRTNDILQELKLQYPQLRILLFEKRTGKGNILNRLVLESKGEICLFTDANITFIDNTIFQLVKHFKNTAVGLIGGNIRSSTLRNDGISIQENRFITQEMKIKHNEGKLWGAMIGAYGACYAIRKSLFEPLPGAFVMDDFYITMKVIEKGKQSILEMNAVCYEHITNLLEEEFRRKVRIATGNFQNMVIFLPMLFHFSGVSFCFFSHKVIRWFGPFLLCMAFVTNLMLCRTTPIYTIAMVLQGILLLIPIIDFFLRKIHIHIIILRFITHFYSMNFALIVGFCKYLKGVKTNVWEPTTREY